MTLSQFYALILVIFGSVAMVCVTLANVLQPHGVDVELTTRLFTFAGIVIGPIVLLMHSNSNKNELKRGQEEVKDEVRGTGS